MFAWMFEWLRVRVADPQYRQESLQEYRRRLQKQKERKTKSNLRNSSSIRADQALIQKAERECYRESPFFDPTEDDIILVERGEEDDGDEEESVYDDDNVAMADITLEEANEMILKACRRSE